MDKDAFSKDVNMMVTSTFVSEVLKGSLAFWGEKLNLNVNINFSPLNTLFRQLLDPSSQVRQNNDVNVLLVRFDDWMQVVDSVGMEHTEADSIYQKFQHNVEELLDALSIATENAQSTFFVYICPSSNYLQSDEYMQLEERFIKGSESMVGVYTIPSSEVFDYYDIPDFYDSYGDEVARTPYKTVYYDALGTLIIRKICSLKCLPYKVIVLDADQTLWKGVWTEDGVTNVVVDQYRSQLQTFMLRQLEAGMLLCLCSKNNSSDIDEAFEKIPDMILKQQHFIAKRVNWERKSDNIKSMAVELNLGLDSFIFIDDNPAECMEVKESCPQVLTFCLPREDSEIPMVLRNIWAFDHLKISDTDRERTKLYVQNIERKQVEQKSVSFDDFLNRLELHVEIETIVETDFERALQLVQRVNQFNFTTIRLQHSDFMEICNNPSSYCFTVKAKDRFGDYGLIGLMICTIREEILVVDNVMLSCRALCKGIEYKMLAKLGEFAKGKNISNIQIKFIQSEKNQLAKDFIIAVVGAYLNAQGELETYEVPSHYLKNIEYKNYLVNNQNASVKIEVESSENKKSVTPLYFVIADEIAFELNTGNKISKQVLSHNRANITREEYIAPRNEIEETIASIWSEVLDIQDIGVNDNLFNLGGDSITAIRILSRIREEFEIDIPLSVLFEGIVSIERLAQATEESILLNFDEDLLFEELEAIKNLSEEEIAAFLKV